MYGIHRDHPAHRRVRPLVANFAFRAGWMSNVVARVGGVRASRETALPLLAAGELVAVFPEGLKGVGKLYRERYRLARFGRGGFVRLAAEARCRCIPVAIVGAEEIHPVIGKITSLAEPLGLPYIPITPTFPWLGPLGLLPVPTKWTIQIRPTHPAAGTGRPCGDRPRGGGGPLGNRHNDRRPAGPAVHFSDNRFFSADRLSGRSGNVWLLVRYIRAALYSSAINWRLSPRLHDRCRANDR